jgi:hypothetical protein
VASLAGAPLQVSGAAAQQQQVPLRRYRNLRFISPPPVSAAWCSVNWEDQNLWVDRAGHLHTLMHAFRGQNTSYPVPGAGARSWGVPWCDGCARGGVSARCGVWWCVMLNGGGGASFNLQP